MFRFLHHYFIPHKGNNHRAKLLHHASLSAIILLLLFTSWISVLVSRTTPDILGVSYSISDRDLLVLVNEKRIENGLPPLKLNETLNAAARDKAQHMFANNYWAHFAPDGTTPWSFFMNKEYDYLYAGENLAKGFTESDEVVEAWMNSETHRENLLSNQYKDMGFAIVEGMLEGEETVLIVQFFGQQRNQFLADSGEVVIRTDEDGEDLNATVTARFVDVAGEQEVVQRVPVQHVQAAPVIDALFSAKALAFIVLSFLVLALVLDYIIVERNRIPRMVGNNLDHILIILIFMVFILVYSTGIII